MSLKRSLQNYIESFTAKSVLVNEDKFVVKDSQDSNQLKKISWSNFLNVLKTYFDSYYSESFWEQTSHDTISPKENKKIDGSDIIGELNGGSFHP